MEKKRITGTQIVIMVLAALLILAVVTGIVFFSIVENGKRFETAGTYTQEGDTIRFLDEQLPIIEESPYPDVIAERHKMSDYAVSQGVDNNIAPFSAESQLIGIVPLAFPTSPVSIAESSSIRLKFYLNGNINTNFSTSVQLAVNDTTGFKVQIPVPYLDDPGDGDAVEYKYRLYYSRDNGTNWSFYESTVSNYIFDLAILGNGNYQICVVEEWKGPSYSDYIRSKIYTVAYNIAALVEIPTPPAKEGYTFVGWYFDQALTQPCTSSFVTEDIILWAKYVINRHTVTFITDGGSAINSIAVDWGTIVNLGSYVSIRTGYDFTDWFTNSACTTSAGSSITVKSNISLYAGWELKKINITLMVDGEVWQTITVDYGTGIMAVVSEISETSAFNIVSFATNGIVYDDVLETAALFSDSLMVLESKPLSEQIQSFDWLNLLMWVGIAVGVIGLSSFITVLIMKGRKRR